MKKLIAFFLLLAVFSGYSQSFSGLILKTKPVNFITLNPGLELEIGIQRRLSLTLDAVYAFRWHPDQDLSLGLDPGSFNIGPGPTYNTTLGYKTGVIGKFYLGRKAALSGMYVGVFGRFRHMDAIDRYPAEKTTRQIMKGSELGLMLGYQFVYQRCTFDISAGALNYRSIRRASFGYNAERSVEKRFNELRPYGNFTVGYRLISQ